MNEYILGSDLKKKFNPKMHAVISADAKYKVVWRDAVELMPASRLDLVLKYQMARNLARGTGSEFVRSAYLAHIDAINGFFENDGSGKMGPDAFVGAFEKLVDSLKRSGFDSNCVVPVRGNEILDGAHRVAAAAALGLRVPTVQLEVQAHTIDHSFLLKNGLSREVVDYAVVSFVRLHQDCRLVLRWPNAEGQDDLFEKELLGSAKIVCRQRIELSAVGKVNIVRFAYQSEPWLGSAADGFEGAVNKSTWCFAERNWVEAFVIRPDSGADLVAMKERIRGIYKVGKHALHITDTYEEAKGLVDLLFNKNGRTLLNAQRVISHPWFDRLSRDFRLLLERFGQDADDYCLVGSAPLAVLGVRDVRDLDFVTISETRDFGLKEIDCHNHDFPRLGVSYVELVTNPNNYFVFEGLKVMSVEFVIEYKRQRDEEKDREDIAAAESILDGFVLSKNLFFEVKKRLSLRYWVRRAKLVAVKIRYYLRKNFL